MKLRVKVLFFIILSTAIVFIGSVGYINYKYWKYTYDMSIKIADLYTKQSATHAQSILNGDLKTVETLKNAFLGYSKINKNTRDKIYNQILKDVLANNPNFLAVWTSWELKAIDDNWFLPYGRERTVTYWNLGNINLKTDSADLEKDNTNSPYFLLKANIEESLITDPYFYSYTQDTGSTFLETSLAKGIYDGDEFVGAVGIDVSLQRFQLLLNDLKPFQNSYILIVSNNGTIVANNKEEFQGKKIDKIFPEYSRFNTMKNIKNGKNFSFEIEYKDKGKNYVSFYPIKVDGSNQPWSLGFVVSSSVIIKDVKQNSTILIILSIASLIIISLIIWFILSIIVGPIEKTTKALEQLSKGNIQQRLKITNKSNDEIGRMATAVNLLIDSLLKTQKFAEQIGQGNLKAEYDLVISTDVLGRSLIEMRDNLLKSQSEEQHRLEESKQISWMQNGITEVNDILRKKSEELDSLTTSLTKFLVNYTESIQGGFYLIEEKDDKKIISLKASYAFDRKKEISSTLEIGEGLVGRAIKEKKTVNITNLPEGYLFVRSGLGDKSPDNLVIIPLLFENVVLGAFELAGFKKYEEFDVEFLTQISIRITSSISVLLKNLETAKLLKESQLQTATSEMRERQFMRQKKRSAKKQQNLEIKSAFLDISLKAIKTLGTYLELDKEKNILEVNSNFLQKLSISRDQIIGKNIDEITIIDETQSHWNSKFWEDINKNIIRKKTTSYKIDTKEIPIKEAFFLVTDIDAVKIIIIGTL